jgi:hypothetical protein
MTFSIKPNGKQVTCSLIRRILFVHLLDMTMRNSLSANIAFLFLGRDDNTTLFTKFIKTYMITVL